MDEKDMLNSNAMIIGTVHPLLMIENCYYLKEKLGEIGHGGLDKPLDWWIHTGLQGYAQVSMTHLLHERILLFCSDLHRSLTSGTTPQELAAQSQYSKPTVRKLFDSWGDRDARVGMGKVFTRVGKHFAEIEQLKGVVWEHVKGYVREQLTQYNKDLQCLYSGEIKLPINIDAILH